MTKCECPETDCTNKRHTREQMCSSEPVYLRGEEILAGWEVIGDGKMVCAGCRPEIIEAVRHGREIAKNARESIFGKEI